MDYELHFTITNSEFSAVSSSQILLFLGKNFLLRTALGFDSWDFTIAEYLSVFLDDTFSAGCITFFHSNFWMNLTKASYHLVCCLHKFFWY